MDAKSLAARLSHVIFLTAGIALAACPARAAVVGVQLGVDRAGIDGDTPPNTAYIDDFGLVAGVQGEFGFAKDLSLSLQPSFVQKRAGVQIAPTTRSGSVTELDLSFDYVSVPVLLKFAQAHGRTYLAGGVTVDFMTSATLSGQGADRDVKSSYNSTGLGAILGFGVAFPAGRTHLTTELRFVQGLTNLNTGSSAATVGALAPRLHTTGWELIVGDLIPLGKR